MQKAWNDIQAWRQAGVDVSGLSLQPEGLKMAISQPHLISGSGSGGCVEGASFEDAQTVLESGELQLRSYDVFR